MMWSWAMLMPSRTSRSLIAHFIAPIVTRKSAMMRSVGSSPAARPLEAVVAGESIVCVTSTMLPTWIIVST